MLGSASLRQTAGQKVLEAFQLQRGVDRITKLPYRLQPAQASEVRPRDLRYIKLVYVA